MLGTGPKHQRWWWGQQVWQGAGQRMGVSLEEIVWGKESTPEAAEVL